MQKSLIEECSTTFNHACLVMVSLHEIFLGIAKKTAKDKHRRKNRTKSNETVLQPYLILAIWSHKILHLSFNKVL